MMLLMLYIKRKSSPCPKTVIQWYTNRYTNGVPQWGTPCFKVTPFPGTKHIYKNYANLEEPDPYSLAKCFAFVLNKIESLKSPSIMAWKPVSSS